MALPRLLAAPACAPAQVLVTAKAAVRARTAARAATATNAGASKPQQFYLVLERTRRSGAKRLLLEVPLPHPVNPVTRRLLHKFPWLVY
eukprot:scaffold37190_cov66-Phaeocystis_antarctica.AAC.1